ncbi:helix-turn-helix transcriptional regulator [Streptomyces sp. NBC_00237]|uniref:helix-turn-helix domain-containing protein n=1 Tax=Streptomyces sp. NBC_00237 TaxID=2975687 RepID=UPI00225964B0|nr:helix-turn-helix transcriptional regulator [Streptomyces sp. NBC_00237]MCX5207274.1 helix-turn-helix transcriptional regulator [Streptomyces sp. NBC_00237]
MARTENKETAGPAARLVARMVLTIRKQRGWSQERLGQELGFTGAAVSAMETCAQPPSDQMLVRLEEVLGEGSGFFEESRKAVRREKFPPLFQDFADLEARAATLFLYSMQTVHGLFQTEAYARALIGGGFPQLSEPRVEELVQARLERRSLLDREPTALIELVIEEAVLTRAIGSTEIMRDQLLHLAACARRRNVTLQVLAQDCGLYGENAGDRGNLTVIETLSNDRLVYLEVQDESILIEDPVKVSLYFQRYAKIRSQAMGPRESLGLIEQLAGEQR